MKQRNKQSGFTLLELLIVVSIILIIAAIAIPKFLSARATASEANAASTMRSLNTALQMFTVKWNAYPADTGALGGVCTTTTPATATSACVLDDVIAQAVKAGTYNGYTWTFTQTASGFTLTAAPLASNKAVRQYYLDQEGTIHYSDTAVPDSTSAVLGN